MKLGYIQKINLELNPDVKEPFRFDECSYNIRINNRGSKIYSKLFYPLDLEEVQEDTSMLKKDKAMMIIKTPIILDDELRSRMKKWVEWANKVDPKEYDPFSQYKNYWNEEIK